MVGFIFGGNTGLSYDDLQDKRARADMLARQIMGQQPKTVAQGIGAVLGGIGAGFGRYQANKGMREGREQATSQFNALVSKITGQPSMAAGPSQMPAVSSSGNIAPTSSSGEFNQVAPRLIADLSRDFGLSRDQASGVVGQLGHESSGFGTLQEVNPLVKGSRGGYGYAQWTGPRRKAFEAWSAENGLDPTSYEANYGFLSHELKNTPEGKALDAVRSAPDALSAGRAFTDRFLHPGIPGYDSRDKWTQRALALAPNEVASLDPSAGMSGAAAIERQAPGSGYVDPQVSAPNALPRPQSEPQPQQLPMPQMGAGPQPFDAARFGGPIPNGMEVAQNGQQMPADALPALPSSTVAPPPPVASVPPQQQPRQAPQRQTSPFSGIDPQTLSLLNNPFLPPEQRQMLQMIVEQQMQANDPYRQMQLEKGQLELDALRNPRAKYDYTTLPDGTVLRTSNLGGAPEKVYESTPKPTADRQNYEYYRDFETRSGRTPLGPLEWEQAQRKAGASSTNVTVGEGDKFYEKLDQKNAETFAALSDAGMAARGKIGQINRLQGLFANVPQGMEGAFKKIAGDWGIPTDGVSDIQAASALLEKMVPEQRAPGSGPMSDADIKMFRASLPRILNQPGGNQLIFQTMRGIAEYEIQMGEIADRVANRELKEDGKPYSPADARRDIQKLQNPLENYKIPEGTTPNAGWKEVTPGVKFRRIGD